MASRSRRHDLWGCGSGHRFPLAPYSIADTTNLTGWWPQIVFLALICWEAVVFGAWCFAVSWFTKQHRDFIWLSPFVWAMLEYFWPRIFRGRSPIHTLNSFLFYSLPRLVAQTSECRSYPKYLFSICDFPQSRCSPRLACVGLVLVATCLAFGIWRTTQHDNQLLHRHQLNVAALQVDPVYVEAVANLQKRSQSLDGDVNLVVWPETSLGHYEDLLTHFRDSLLVAEYSEAPNPAEDPTKGMEKSLLLAGGKVYRHGTRDTGPYLNTAFLISPSKDIIGRYVKRNLCQLENTFRWANNFPF